LSILKKNNELAVLTVVVFTGIATLVTQLFMVRECIAQFSGNEFVITLILFSWLSLGGIGNQTARFLNGKTRPGTKIGLAWITVGLAVAPVFSLYAVRCLRDLVFIHGSTVGFYPTFIFIFLSMAPYGLLVGIALPYGLFVLRQYQPESSGTRIYLMDNLGNVMGGLLFSFVLIFLTTPLQSIFITGSLLLLSVYLLIHSASFGRWPVLVAAGMGFILLSSGLLFENTSLMPDEGNLVYYKESRFGRITVHKNREQYTLFEDGNPILTSRDIPLAEETVHYPLSQVKNPKRILLIAARAGMMVEIEKYHPESIDYVELDPDMTSVLFKYEFIRHLGNQTTVIHQDARAYLSQTGKHYDAIIVNLPDPTTFQINRFFTDQFFLLAKQHLVADGVFSFSAPGFENYVSEPLRQKLSSLYNTVSDHFNFVTLLPGNHIYFLCQDRPIHLDIPDQLSKKGISTLYVSRFYHGNLTPDRIAGLNGLIDPLTKKNEDLSPHLIRLMFREWFSLHQTSPKGFIIVATILGIAYLIFINKTEFVLFSTGFVTMGSEVLTIFAVQIFFGYIYSQIGMIVTVFLAGLFPGAWLGARWHGDKKHLLMAVDAGLAASMLIFIGRVGSGTTPPPQLFFMLFGMVMSLGCGCQFPLALYRMKNHDAGAVRSFSADLIGAAFGTLVTSLLFIPILGIIGAAYALISLKGLSLNVIFTESSYTMDISSCVCLFFLRKMKIAPLIKNKTINFRHFK
jgi:spermidine synthase